MKLLASLLLIGATSAPVLAGPATGYKSKWWICAGREMF